MENLKGIKGWLLFYLIISIPLAVFYTGALTGWVLDYPLWLVIPIITILLIPLILILLKDPRAPKWNINTLWILAVLIPVRMLTGIMAGTMGDVTEYIFPIIVVTLFPILWALIWIKYFKSSKRVKYTFYST